MIKFENSVFENKQYVSLFTKINDFHQFIISYLLFINYYLIL